MRKVTAILIVLLALSAFAQNSAVSRYLAGNQAYRSGDFAGAIQAYNEAISSGANDYRVYYNLGNAYYRTNQPGEAILSFERARYLKPRNEDIIFNINFLKARVAVVQDSSSIADVYENTFLGLIYKNLAKVSFSELAWIINIFFGIGVIFFILSLLLRSNARRALFGLTITAWAIALVVLAPYAIKKTHIWETKLAIVIAPNANIYSAPDEGSTLKYAYREGMEVAVKENSAGWSKVALRNGEEGWVQNSLIEKVVIGNGN
jgi:tetratricopeptide (TPR) repeat protein